MKKYSLPGSWVWTTIGELALHVITGNTPSKKDTSNYGNDILFIKPPQLINRPIYDSVDKLSRKGGQLARIVPKNSVLVSCIGILGKTGISKFHIAFNQQINAIICPENINPFFGFYYVQTSFFNQSLSQLASATTIPIVNKSKFETIPMPVPPLAEQHRIVAKIEELFTKLDAGVEALKQVQTQLKRYRQSVLKAAVEGKLTAEWREQHKNELEPADILLERILIERHKKWESEQLTKYKDQGKTPPKNWQNKYKEPIFSNPPSLPELPKSWIWASIDQLSYEVRYGTSSRADTEPNGIPVLRMGNIVEGNLIFDRLKYLPDNHDEFPDLLMVSGDLLFNRTNSVELVGKTAVYGGYPSPCSYASYLIRVRFCRGIDPNFISFFINSVYGRAWIKTVLSQQVGQANVNGTKLKNLIVPLPSFEEQKRIVSEADRIFSIINESESLMKKEINRAQSLQQAVLKHAFEGKLVPQNPNDEPASVLLERINAERAKPRKSKQMEMF